ncbi:MAG: 3-deoxy-8-phosphooctulonate synthase [Candidatus Saelkia tenebricola]|nr:3-deoxy-8-phosphooctulonate synthase [Candidatus Saelkia tenebricola]
MNKRCIKISNLEVGQGHKMLFILGPCVIESLESLMEHAKEIKEIANSEDLQFIFKASYDKANRTSLNSFRGPGVKEGIKMLKEVKQELGILVTSDVHTPQEVSEVSDVLDLIQIPALLSRQTDLIVEAGKTGKPINIKKGQFMAPWDMVKAVDKVRTQGNSNVCVTERGVCFGYNYLVNDFKAIPRMQKDGLVVIFDATHSTQLPSYGVESSGEHEFIPYLARAAVAIGADGLFAEVHKNPIEALADSTSMLKLSNLKGLIRDVKRIREALQLG